MEGKKYGEEVTKARERMHMLRGNLMQRVISRMSNQPGGMRNNLRAQPDQYPPMDESKRQQELQLVKLIAECLLDLSTSIPIEVSTLHKRVSTGIPLLAQHWTCLMKLHGAHAHLGSHWAGYSMVLITLHTRMPACSYDGPHAQPLHKPTRQAMRQLTHCHGYMHALALA